LQRFESLELISCQIRKIFMNDLHPDALAIEPE
jgi:hypothetical protein